MIGTQGLFKPLGDNSVEKFMYAHHLHHRLGDAMVEWSDEYGNRVTARIVACHPEIMAFSVIITDVKQKE